MRELRQSDVCCAARALIAVPASARAALCERLFRHAHAADKFTRRLGKPHPKWGNGSLQAAARAYPLQPEPTFGDRDFARAFVMILKHRENQRL